MFKYINDNVENGDGYMSSGCVFINSHTISQRDYSSNVHNIYGDVYNIDVSSGFGDMNNHTGLEKIFGIID